MKRMIKDLAKNTAIGIGIAFAIFCLLGAGFDVYFEGNFKMEHYQFTKMVIGCLIVGTGFGAPAIVYQKDNLPMPVCCLIHMGTGCVVYTIVAYAVGWLGSPQNIVQGVLAVLLQIGIAFAIWFLFLLHYRHEARKMNERIQEMK